MPLISQPNALANGTPADGSEVYENIQTVVNLVNGGLDADNIAGPLPGTVISTTSPIPTNRIADDAVTADKLKDDPVSPSSGAAVATSGHIKDGIVTKAKISGKLTLAQLDITKQSYAYTSSVLSTRTYVESAHVCLTNDGTNYKASLTFTTGNNSNGVFAPITYTVPITPATNIAVASNLILGVYLDTIGWTGTVFTCNVVFIYLALT